jgi:hypothetical protein
MRYLQSLHHGRRRTNRKRLAPFHGEGSLMEHDAQMSAFLRGEGPRPERTPPAGMRK